MASPTDLRVSPCTLCGGDEHPAHTFTAAPGDFWFCQKCLQDQPTAEPTGLTVR